VKNEDLPLELREQIAEKNKRVQRQIIINVVGFVLIKGAIYYGIHRWAKSLRNDSEN